MFPDRFSSCFYFHTSVEMVYSGFYVVADFVRICGFGRIGNIFVDQYETKFVWIYDKLNG